MKTEFEVKQSIDELKRVADTREFTVGAWEMAIELLLDIRLLAQLLVSGLIRQGGGK